MIFPKINVHIQKHIYAQKMLQVRQDLDLERAQEHLLRFICVVKIELPGHGLHAEALGVGEQTWNPAGLEFYYSTVKPLY